MSRRYVLRRTPNFGYNAATETFEDLVAAGVIDPAKVTRCALQNAASIAGLMLTTEALISELQEDDKPRRDVRRHGYVKAQGKWGMGKVRAAQAGENQAARCYPLPLPLYPVFPLQVATWISVWTIKGHQSRVDKPRFFGSWPINHCGTASVRTMTKTGATW